MRIKLCHTLILCPRATLGPMKSSAAMTHPATSIVPVLNWMEGRGHSIATCLKGTRVSAETVTRPERSITLQQEIAFYRNMLRLSGDSTIGLQLGKLFTPRNLGLLGYAMLSAPTLRQALVIAAHFGDYLTFTWFHMNFVVEGEVARFEFSDRFDIDTDVRDLLYDRDCTSTRECISEFIGNSFPCTRISLPHDGHGRQTDYAGYWDCDIVYGAKPAGIEFASALLETPLPFKDPVASERISQQCQLLLANMTYRSGLAEDVRQMLIGRPGYFPDIEVVAQRLDMPVRTLRHRLCEEGTGYQTILDEVRFAIAREYLIETPLPNHEIASLLGYTDPGNFTHAFKRWAGVAPRKFRADSLRSKSHI